MEDIGTVTSRVGQRNYVASLSRRISQKRREASASPLLAATTVRMVARRSSCRSRAFLQTVQRPPMENCVRVS